MAVLFTLLLYSVIFKCTVSVEKIYSCGVKLNIGVQRVKGNVGKHVHGVKEIQRKLIVSWKLLIEELLVVKLGYKC